MSVYQYTNMYLVSFCSNFVLIRLPVYFTKNMWNNFKSGQFKMKSLFRWLTVTVEDKCNKCGREGVAGWLCTGVVT